MNEQWCFIAAYKTGWCWRCEDKPIKVIKEYTMRFMTMPQNGSLDYTASNIVVRTNRPTVAGKEIARRCNAENWTPLAFAETEVLV